MKLTEQGETVSSDKRQYVGKYLVRQQCNFVYVYPKQIWLAEDILKTTRRRGRAAHIVIPRPYKLFKFASSADAAGAYCDICEMARVDTFPPNQ